MPEQLNNLVTIQVFGYICQEEIWQENSTEPPALWWGKRLLFDAGFLMITFATE